MLENLPQIPALQCVLVQPFDCGQNAPGIPKTAPAKDILGAQLRRRAFAKKPGKNRGLRPRRSPTGHGFTASVALARTRHADSPLSLLHQIFCGFKNLPFATGQTLHSLAGDLIEDRIDFLPDKFLGGHVTRLGTSPRFQPRAQVLKP
jgi:hypothetical protein